MRDARAFVPMSPQPPVAVSKLFASWTFDTEISEDCLGVNVWTPALRDGRKRPVMVWFHGGAYSSLSGSRNVYDGARLCKRGDVVVVTLNHRLNSFGFLHLADIAPEFADAGNAGMLDLVAALQWVRDNIAEFGGDAGNVTIFGQSGGGGKVSTMMAMPAGKGLFHRAIVQSGSYARNAHLEAMGPAEATEHTRALLTASSRLRLCRCLRRSLSSCQWKRWWRARRKSRRCGGRRSLTVARCRPVPGGLTHPRSPQTFRS